MPFSSPDSDQGVDWVTSIKFLMRGLMPMSTFTHTVMGGAKIPIWPIMVIIKTAGQLSTYTLFATVLLSQHEIACTLRTQQPLCKSCRPCILWTTVFVQNADTAKFYTRRYLNDFLLICLVYQSLTFSKINCQYKYCLIYIEKNSYYSFLHLLSVTLLNGTAIILCYS